MATKHSRQSLYPPQQPNPPANTSMADQLPPISFNFDDLRDRMSKFTVKFDTYISTGRKKVLDERNEFRGKVTEMDEDHKLKTRSIEILAAQSQTHAQTLEKESLEKQDLVESISSLSLQKTNLTTHRDALLAEIASAKSAIEAKLSSQAAHQAKQDSLAKYNLPELDFWVDYLCMRIEGTGTQDRLRFVFSHLDERDWSREGSFELCMGEHEYKVEGCKPKVDKGRLGELVDRVNEGRDVAGFLKVMRGLLGESMKG